MFKFQEVVELRRFFRQVGLSIKFDFYFDFVVANCQHLNVLSAYPRAHFFGFSGGRGGGELSSVILGVHLQ